MNRFSKRRIIYLLAAVTLACGSTYALKSSECLQQALYAEQIEGDLPAAIANYQAIIDDAASPEEHTAQALYRQGLCYMQLKQDEKAAIALSRLVSDYAGQSNLVEKAKSVLDSIQIFDPASLMPPETLAYLELGSTGRQLETILGMLKGTPLEDPLLAISQSDPEALRSGAGPIIAGLLNPAMKEDFKKIRGLAVGLVDIQPNHPEAVAVLHLGDSTMLRSLLMTGLSMVARPGAAIEGMPTYSIQGQLDVAGDGQVLLVSFPSGRLPWMIRQYKHLSSDTTLATGNPSFSQMDKVVRQQNLATLWANTDDLFTRFSQRVNNMEILMAGGVVNVATIDDLMLTASLAADAIGIDGRIRLKDGSQNMIYEMIKTPTIHRDGLKGIPANAVGLLSFDLQDGDSMQAAQLRQLVLSNIGVDLSSELIDSIQQVTVFGLPYDDITQQDMPARPGVMIQFTDSAPVVFLLETLRPMLDELDIKHHLNEGSVVFALDEEVLDAVKATMAGAPSVLDSGALSAKANKYSDSAEKLALIDVAGLIRWAASDNLYVLPNPVVTEEMNQRMLDQYEILADVLQGASFSLHTAELEQELRIEARLDGIPEVSGIIDAFRGIMVVEGEYNTKFMELRQQEAAERAIQEQKNQRTVTIRNVENGAGPAIDGELDEVWNTARGCTVDRPVSVSPSQPYHGSPIAGCELAADFRMLYDSENLYVYIDVTDSTPNHNPDLSWQFSDNVVLYIDALGARNQSFGRRDFEYAFCWDEAQPVAEEFRNGGMTGVEYTIKTTDKGYCVEAALPWTTLGTPLVGGFPQAGTALGIDVQLSDNQAGVERNYMLGWKDDTNGAWQRPILFGRGELAAQVGGWPVGRRPVVDEDSNGVLCIPEISAGSHNGVINGSVRQIEANHKQIQDGEKTIVASKFQAIELDGNSYAMVGDEPAFDIAGEMTIECWVNLYSVTADWIPIITKGDTSWRLSTEGRESKFHLGLNDQPYGARVHSDNAVGLNEWHHVAGTYDGTTMRLYVDGVLSGEEMYDGGIALNDCPVMIGANAEAPDRHFHGAIAGVSVYNYARTADQILKDAYGVPGPICDELTIETGE
ncbi:MAG: hypothetical protein JXR25_12430 [Pontiellaceae bacterium]|nr:hypothetical protein [Pontiellaceae bacterium]MBN2785622.1 hypothetical protein [Pontiellaceae bacterium]